MDYQLLKELNKTKLEQEIIANELKKEQEKIAYNIKNGMGKEIIEVINGREKVKLTFKEKMKYKYKNIINKIFNTF